MENILNLDLKDHADQELMHTDPSVFGKVSDYNDFVVEDIANDNRTVAKRDWNFNSLQLFLELQRVEGVN